VHAHSVRPAHPGLQSLRLEVSSARKPKPKCPKSHSNPHAQSPWSHPSGRPLTEWAYLEPEPVAPGRHLLQAAPPAAGGYGGYGASAGYGAYGGAGRRRQLAEAGGYGGYGGYGASGGAYGSGRHLLEWHAAPDGREQQDRGALAGPGVAAAWRAQQQRQQAAVAAAAGAASAAPNAAIGAALRAARAAAAVDALAPPPGRCYCRYNVDYSTWALGEEPCKRTLLAKCQAGALPCAWLEAYYGHAAGTRLAHTLPHEQDILGYVFDDCQPQPPCACVGVRFDGSDSGEWGQGRGPGGWRMVQESRHLPLCCTAAAL
jgi:hypothetical protein